MFRLQNKPVKIYHILDYNNSSYKWKIKNQLEFFDLLIANDGVTGPVFEHFHNKYKSHVEFVCSDLYNDFNDNNTNIWKILALDLFKSVGFEGPHDFGTVLDKHLFRDNFDSACDRICDDYHTLILGNYMDFPSHKCENHQLFDCTK